MTGVSELPELTYASLHVGQQFCDTVLDATPDLVRSYARAVANQELLAEAEQPAGTAIGDASLLIVFGITRRVLARDGRVPPGGILAGQDHEFRGAIRLGEQIRTETSIAGKYEKRGRRYVQLRCRMFDNANQFVGQVDSHIIWAR